MAGEWIPEKARGLIGIFPGSWEEVQDGIYQGRCPGEHLHHGTNAATDCRIHIGYGKGGESPGIYCLHQSCKGVLEPLNKEFRDAIFAKDNNWQPANSANAGVVMRPPRSREEWIPDFSIQRLRKLVEAVPACGVEYFLERSPVDPRKVSSGEFIEHVFEPGQRVLVFTEFTSQGDFLWEVGKGGYRLSDQRGVAAVRSKLPSDGGPDGIWYLVNPVTGKWDANPRRGGHYSRRSMESVTAWKHVVVECDEEKTFRKRAAVLRTAAGLLKDGKEEEAVKYLENGGPKWAKTMVGEKPRWEAHADRLQAEAKEIPGLWMRFLAMIPAAVVAIYSSGGDSWHALLRVDQPDKASFDTYLRMHAKRVLPIFGADPGAMTPVRLSRLPACTRKGKEQRLIFLNPKVLATSATPIRDFARMRTI